MIQNKGASALPSGSHPSGHAAFDPSRIRPLEMLAYFGNEFERLGEVSRRYGLPNVQWAVKATKLLHQHRLVERMTGFDCGRWRITAAGRAKLIELASAIEARRTTQGWVGTWERK